MTNPSFTVLIADDDAGHRESIGALLRRRGHRTELAESGTQALEIARSSIVHAVVFDVHMPGLTGIEACRRILTIVDRLPCILMSGRASKPLREEAFSAGAAEFFEKPVDLRRLVTVLDELLKTRW